MNRTPILLKAISFAITLVLSIYTYAQEMVIINPGQLYSTYKLTTQEKDKIKTQVSSYELEKILKYCNESAWPEGIENLSNWIKNKEEMKKYRVYKVATFSDKTIVVAPSAENQFMRYDMRPATDIYFIMGNDAVQPKSGNTEKPAAPSASGTKVKGTPATLISTGGLYSDFNLSTDEDAESIRKQIGDEFDEAAIYCKDDNWPSGIATLTAREGIRSKMNNYMVYKIASFDGKYLLRVPAAENKFMPYNMQPTHDIYFVINQEDVTLGAAAKSKPEPTYNNTETKSNKGVPAIINATGGMYSTFDIAGSAFVSSIRKQLGSAYNDAVLYCKETYWPKGIASFSARETVRERMNDYKGYMVAEFDDKYILLIPAAENKFMPYDMRPTQDIYFVINKKDVTLNGEATKNYNTPEEEEDEPTPAKPNSNNPKPIGGH